MPASVFFLGRLHGYATYRTSGRTKIAGHAALTTIGVPRQDDAGPAAGYDIAGVVSNRADARGLDRAFGGRVRAIDVDVRVVAATNRDLQDQQSGFRQDLFFRISVIHVGDQRYGELTKTFGDYTRVRENVAEGADPIRDADGNVVAWKKNIYSFPPVGSPDSGAHVTARDLADRAGISLKTYRNVEAGENHSVATLLRILRALGLLQRVDALLPEPGLSPIELAKLGGKQRKRATGTRRGRDEAWQW